MKDIKNYILEGYKKPTKPYIIKDIDGNDVEFEPSRYEILNKAFEWVCKHCVIDKSLFEKEKWPYTVAKAVFKSNKYELKSVLFALDPEDKDLIDRNKIKSNSEHQKLIDKYKGTLKDDQIIGQLIPYSLIQKNHTAYTEIILTNKNILANYIDDYAFPISDEKIV